MPEPMRMVCRLALLVFALFVGVTDHARATRLVLPQQLQSTHFLIHFDGNPVPPQKQVLYQDAGDLAATLEQAYDLYVNALGYAPPLDDGDGLIDVYVTDLSPVQALGIAFADAMTNQSSGYLQIDEDEVLRDATATPSHELFHLIQYAQWRPLDAFMLEGTAEWAAFNLLNFPLTVDVGAEDPVPLKDTIAKPDISLTCSGGGCGADGYEAGGYSRWHFYQYLTERFGGQPVKDLLAKARALNDPALSGGAVLSSYLADRGTLLSDVFNDWTVVNLTGNYTAPGLKGIEPVPHRTLLTGAVTGSLPPVTLAVNHLAARYLAFKRGSGSSGPCYKATLTINVTLPAGTASRPYFQWTEPGSVPIPLAITGSTASASIPWDTCTWEFKGFLSLPNASSTIDGALFSVNAYLNVDRTKLTTSSTPPKGPYTGPTVPAPDVEEPPTIALYGPETVRVSRKKRVLRLVVFAGSEGRLDVQLGSLGLGTRTLRTGNNDLRFAVPQSAVRTLANTRMLTVTALSSDGIVRGDSLTRKLVLTK